MPIISGSFGLGLLEKWIPKVTPQIAAAIEGGKILLSLFTGLWSSIEKGAGRLRSLFARNRRVAEAGAQSAVNALRLGKQLASESGVAELATGGGKIIAGAGTRVPIRDVSRLVSEYGGKVGDWAKVASTTHKFSDLTTIETHAYRNIATGHVVEFKSKIGAWSP